MRFPCSFTIILLADGQHTPYRCAAVNNFAGSFADSSMKTDLSNVGEELHCRKWADIK